RGVYGKERLSRMFEYELLLQRAEPYTDDQLDELLKAPCAISMGPKSGDVVHGLLKSIQMLDHDRHTNSRYIATMVPNLWLLTITQTSAIYQDTTVPDMVTKILTNYGLQSSQNFDVRVNIK